MTGPQLAVSDIALIKEMMAGDERALSAMYDRYSGMLYGMLVRILRDKQAAEEVLQDLFLQLWRNPGRFDAARGSVPAWLMVIGRNRAISKLRGRATRDISEQQQEDDYATTFVSSQNVEEEAYRMELAEKVKAALIQLPAEQRRALELAYFEGMTQTEIASATGSPLGTVKTRVRTAMQSLKQMLDDARTRQPGRS